MLQPSNLRLEIKCVSDRWSWVWYSGDHILMRSTGRYRDIAQCFIAAIGSGKLKGWIYPEGTVN